MNNKMRLEMRTERGNALARLGEELMQAPSESRFIVVPQGGAGLNLDPGTLTLLVTFFENGGIEFVQFLVDRITAYFRRENVRYIEIVPGDAPPIRIESNMSEGTIVEIVKNFDGVPNE